MRRCDCHPWSEEDERDWRIVKKTPRTKAQWQRLHNLLEDERRMLLDDYRVTAASESQKP